MRKKALLGWGIAASIGVAAALLLSAQRSDPVTAPLPSAQLKPAVEASRFAALAAREGFSRPRGEVFGASVPEAKGSAAGSQAAPESLAPTAPPMPYRIAGQAVREGVPQVVLARDDRVLTVREGDVLDGGYRVESVSADGVTLVYVPLDIRERLTFNPVLPAAAPAADASPARLRWEGPEQVQAGTNFNVTLKITSRQPVRGSPVQLSYDAKLLEPIAVRAGQFVADGSFTYRVNPGGSIVIGAFGNGSVAADAELLVVTFKPIRPGATAELKLSSLALQGATGRALVHEPLGAFRTAITQ